MARYASENGVTRAIRHYKDLNLKEASVRDWKLYEKELQSRVASNCSGTNQPETRVTVNSLPSMKRGRPPLSGEKADEYFYKIL